MIKVAENPIIKISNLSVSYNKKQVLCDINLTIPQGQIIGILGPNGAGKSTFLKSIMNLIPIDFGLIKIFNNRLEDVRQEISYIPQKELIDWNFPVSVFDVVLMGRYGRLGFFKNPTKVDRKIALEALEMVNLMCYKNVHISQLSGGQQQRVFIARALSQKAKIYLMDEPFSAVDKTTEKIIIQILKNLTLEKKTILVVHHDLQTVEEYFNWLILLNKRLVASSYTKDVLTNDLLSKTYEKFNIMDRMKN